MTSTMLQGNSKEPRTYWVEDIAIILGIGRTSAYKLVQQGLFKVVRIGSSIRISRSSFNAWRESQDSE